MFQFCFQFGKEEKEEGREKKLREEGRREGGGREGEKVELNSVYLNSLSVMLAFLWIQPPMFCDNIDISFKEAVSK